MLPIEELDEELSDKTQLVFEPNLEEILPGLDVPGAFEPDEVAQVVVEVPAVGGPKPSIQASSPEAAAFVESIRGTLAGDLAALQKYYGLELSGNEERWKLQLVPQQPRMAKLVSRIRIEGSGDPYASIAFVGEAPSWDELTSEEAFTGPSMKL